MKTKEIFDFVSYDIKTKKLKIGESKKVLLIADLHAYLNNKNNTLKLSNAIKKCNPHHIVIAGDILQGKKWEKEENLKEFSKLLKNVSEVAPVFITLGNHDLTGLNDKNKSIRETNFKKLEDINPDKIHCLINDIVTYDNFDIIGYIPKPYIISGLDIQEHGIAHDMFIKEYMEKAIKYKNNKNHIVEFVGHNPHLIARSESNIGLEDLSVVDTFYTGHLHNGYIRSSKVEKNPDWFLDFGYVERFYSKNKDGKFIFSSIRPMYGKTSLCRGVVYIDDDSQRKLLLLRNGNYYYNKNFDKNCESWVRLTDNNANNYLNENKLHAVVITGGIRKFFITDIPHDKPEITLVNYIGQ